MPRLPRLHVPGGMYHAILRGNHREDIFSAAQDRLALNDIVAEALEKTGARVHAFCWMTNHLHLLIQNGDLPLGKVMQRIATHYSRYRHRQLRTTGHLFERRYRAKLVEADIYFITLLRYIHQNPIQAGLVRSADDYRWSSHRAYLGLEQLPWLCIDFGLSLFCSSVEPARRAYRWLIEQELFASECQEIESAHPSDARVLGTDGFLDSLLTPRIKPKSPLTLMQVAEQVCASVGVSVESVKSPSKLRQLATLRVEIARRAIDGRIASLNEIARFLNRSPSSMCALLHRHSQG